MNLNLLHLEDLKELITKRPVALFDLYKDECLCSSFIKKVEDCIYITHFDGDNDEAYLSMSEYNSFCKSDLQEITVDSLLGNVRMYFCEINKQNIQSNMQGLFVDSRAILIDSYANIDQIVSHMFDLQEDQTWLVFWKK